MVPIFARNTLLGGAILLNCLENERTVSIDILGFIVYKLSLRRKGVGYVKEEIQS